MPTASYTDMVNNHVSTGSRTGHLVLIGLQCKKAILNLIWTPLIKKYMFLLAESTPQILFALCIVFACITRWDCYTATAVLEYEVEEEGEEEEEEKKMIYIVYINVKPGGGGIKNDLHCIHQCLFACGAAWLVQFC